MSLQVVRKAHEEVKALQEAKKAQKKARALQAAQYLQEAKKHKGKPANNTTDGNHSG
jgi:hypothetical protein